MKIRIAVIRKTHQDADGHTFETLSPSNYVNTQTEIRWHSEREGFARVNITPAGREAAKHHGVL